jgi:malate dehydrogenase (quinone)
VVLIGAGIMSATLGVFLKELEPSLGIEMDSDSAISKA